MGYNKLIICGKTAELYEYERSIRSEPGFKTPRDYTRNATASMAFNGEDSLQREAKGRRSDNARRASMAFTRLVKTNLGTTDTPLLVTITYAENIKELKQGYADFKAFMRSLRNLQSTEIRYISVPEFQLRGALHFHTLVWGLSSNSLLPERRTGYFKNVSPTLSRLWKQGLVFLKPTDANDKIASYLAKYMAKTFIDSRLKNQKAYVTSRNILRPIILKGFPFKWPVLDEWVGVDNSPVQYRSFDTQWLGKGRMSVYQLN